MPQTNAVLHPIAAAVMLTLLHTGASAQVPAAEGGLTTVTVTAERRVENVRDVPSSISVLNADLLDALRYAVMARPAPGQVSANKAFPMGSLGWLLAREARKPKGVLSRRA